MNERLSEKLKTLPRTSGVYFHKAASGEVIYVGKAAVLKNRVRQYFQNTKDMDVKTRALVAEIDDTDWVETESEIDALFLESEMVKRYMPRYNILLRDDKSQTYIRIDTKSEWPYVCFTRNPADDGAEYFGPYFNAYILKKALRHLRKTFPYYTKAPRLDARPSLDAHLGLDPHGLTSQQYHVELRKLISYIKGSRVQLARELERDMKTAAAGQDFELAATLRNRLYNMKELQRKIMFGDKEFLDISKDKALRQLVDLFSLPKVPARIEGYDISHMSGTNVVASMVVFTNGVSDRAGYRKFKMSTQQNDDYASMYETVFRRTGEKNLKGWGVPDLLLIDGGKGQLDASLSALEARGAMIPTVSVAKREEEIVVHRTRSHIDVSALDSLAASPAPGVSVMRSGEYYIVNLHAGQLNAGSHSGNLRGGAPIHSGYTDVVKLFQRIRDESHRFAVSYHTVLKRQKQTASTLEDIPGVGPATRRKLIKHFGSLRGVQAAQVAELTDAIGVSKAAIIARYLSKK